MAHWHFAQPCTTLYNLVQPGTTLYECNLTAMQRWGKWMQVTEILTECHQESVVQTAFSTPCVEASLASKASLHRDFNVEVLPPSDTCCANGATNQLLILTWSLKDWNDHKTWWRNEHQVNIFADCTLGPTRHGLQQRWQSGALHTHTRRQTPRNAYRVLEGVQGYPGLPTDQIHFDLNSPALHFVRNTIKSLLSCASHAKKLLKIFTLSQTAHNLTAAQKSVASHMLLVCQVLCW